MVALGNLALELPEVSEVDVNPIRVADDLVCCGRRPHRLGRAVMTDDELAPTWRSCWTTGPWPGRSRTIPGAWTPGLRPGAVADLPRRGPIPTLGEIEQAVARVLTEPN